MTIKEARKILGKQASNVSDDILAKDIEVAELLKDLFFSLISKEKIDKNASKRFSNMP